MYKFKILVPLWGLVHIERFFKFPYASLLAKGNMPFLAQQYPCDVYFMTTKESILLIDNILTEKPLPANVKTNYIEIDDLVSFNNYGLTLSLAYERVIRSDSDEEQLNTHYIFMNGDFVLSNNTYESVIDILDKGYTSILCPSVRVNEEYVDVELNKLFDKTQLDVRPRDLVSIALRHLHPTVIASGIDSANITTHIAHQCYMRVNSDILIGRFFLFFMLCIKPEQPLQEISAFCDYSFIPEMCPSGNYKLISDSDMAFLMEVSPLEKEAKTVHFGNHYENLHLYNTLSDWVTDYQQKNSKTTVIFHAKELPSEESECLIFNDAIISLDNKLSKIYDFLDTMQPRPTHDNHYYWVTNIEFQQSQGKLIDRKVGHYIRPQPADTPKLIPRERKDINRLYHFLKHNHKLLLLSPKFVFKKLLNILTSITTNKFKAFIVSKKLSASNLMHKIYHKVSENYNVLNPNYKDFTSVSAALINKKSLHSKVIFFSTKHDKYSKIINSIISKSKIKSERYSTLQDLSQTKCDKNILLLVALALDEVEKFLVELHKIQHKPQTVLLHISTQKNAKNNIYYLKEKLAPHFSILNFSYNTSTMLTVNNTKNLIRIESLKTSMSYYRSFLFKCFFMLESLFAMTAIIIKNIFLAPHFTNNLYSESTSTTIELNSR